MTRRIVAAALLAGVAALTPATAHASSVIAEAEGCPPGDTGVVVKTLGKTLTICTNI